MTTEVVAVPLSGGRYFTFVDKEDEARVRQYKWRASIRTSKSGTVRIYACRHVSFKDPVTGKRRTSSLYLHRFILDAPSDLMVDHANSDSLDNTRRNLRLATPSQNKWNAIPPKRSIYGRGVYKAKKRKRVDATKGELSKPYVAAIKFNGQRLSLGYYATAHEAALAYDRAAIQYHGEFAVLNYPNAHGFRYMPQAVLMAAE